MATQTEAHTEKETGRIEAFSDGVFAIAITLLVLDIKVPPVNESPDAPGLGRLLLDQWPMYLAFLTSFGTILIMWLNHHRLFSLIKRSTHMLLIFNGLLLLGVTIVPFPTELVATYLQHRDQEIAAMVYSGLFMLIAILFNMLWWYANSQGLLGTDVDPTATSRVSRQYIFGPLMYLIALLLALISVPLSLALNLLLAIFYALPNSILDSILQRGNR